jgi:serine/threonine protein kinase
MDFFGNVSADEIKACYYSYAKIVHPDQAVGDNRLAGETMSILNRVYKQALSEIADGIYGIVKPLDIYARSDPLFQFDISGRKLKFYEHFFAGEVADLYKGTDENNIVFLKVAIDDNDNHLIEKEFALLSRLSHQSLPIVEEQIVLNNKAAFLMREAEGTPLPELLLEYPRGIPAEHVMWMLERLLSGVGYLHFNKIVHGNIKPEQIVVNRDNHNVFLLGFSFSIEKADQKSAYYQIVNDIYSPPEVDKYTTVRPNVDIYAIGKLAVLMLGGKVETDAMPVKVDKRIRNFVRRLVKEDPGSRPNNAWGLWDEVITLRNTIYGTARFQTLK